MLDSRKRREKALFFQSIGTARKKHNPTKKNVVRPLTHNPRRPEKRGGKRGFFSSGPERKRKEKEKERTTCLIPTL